MLLIYRVKKETTTENQSQLTQPVAYRKRMRHVGMFPSLSLLEDWTLSSVQSLSRVRLFATPQTAALQASLSITNSQSLLKLMSIESVMPFNHLTLCHPLLLLPLIFPSIRVFSNESVLRIRWPKYWSFSFSISPSNEYSGLISFSHDFGCQENKVYHCFHRFHIYFPWSDGTRCHDLSFLNVEF